MAGPIGREDNFPLISLAMSGEAVSSQDVQCMFVLINIDFDLHINVYMFFCRCVSISHGSHSYIHTYISTSLIPVVVLLDFSL